MYVLLVVLHPNKGDFCDFCFFSFSVQFDLDYHRHTQNDFLVGIVRYSRGDKRGGFGGDMDDQIEASHYGPSMEQSINSRNKATLS